MNQVTLTNPASGSLEAGPSLRMLGDLFLPTVYIIFK